MEKTPEPEKGPDPGTPEVSDEDAKQPGPPAEPVQDEPATVVPDMEKTPEPEKGTRSWHSRKFQMKMQSSQNRFAEGNETENHSEVDR